MPKKEKGFSLIELLVAVAVFSLIIGVLASVFASFVKYQRWVFTKQELLNQTSFALEYMGRALRMAKVDLAGGCLTTGVKRSYENPNNNVSAIRFINHIENDICQEFSLSGSDGQLQETRIISGRINSPVFLTSDKFAVKFLQFKLSGERRVSDDGQPDPYQPRATIFIEIQAKGQGPQPKLQIQTTISQRNLDVSRY